MKPVLPKEYDIITFGDMCVDLIMTGEDVVPQFGQVEKLVGDYELEMGGSCNIFACQAAKLGLKVGILGRVGDDDFGRLILRRLNECGVDTQHVIVDSVIKTGIGVALCQGGDRAILTYLGSLSEVYPRDIREDFLSSARHLHHGSFFLHTNLRPAIPKVFQRACELGLTTSLDTNWDPDETWNSTLQEALLHTHVFLPNDQEALFISGVQDIEGALNIFQEMGVGITVIKKGADGTVMAAGNQRFTYGLPEVTGGDSIGAGDSFDAGFLAGWLRGLPMMECLKIASHCGREVAAQIGGLRGQPDWKRVQTLLSNS
jgi:sugar/nucleoside kinase (ribokinase family)